MRTKQENNPDNIIEVEGLSFAYDRQLILDNVSLELRCGEFLAILGPNGSGKSTLIKILLGLLKPRRGRIAVLGEPVEQLRDRWRIGYVSQKANSFNQGFPATVREVVASGMYGKKGLFSRMKRQDWHKVDEVLEQVGLIGLANRNIGKLSGGLQQRAFIARALVSDPELLILDEPTVGVDASSTERFYDLLSHLHKDRGLSMVLVTHDISVVTTCVDFVACLNKRLFFHGRSDDFVELQDDVLSVTYGHDVQVIEHGH